MNCKAEWFHLQEVKSVFISQTVIDPGTLWLLGWFDFCSYSLAGSCKMPEGPELHLASLYVNKMCNGLIFTGAVRKSEVSKSPDVSFTCQAYRITATSRGKEVKLTLTPMKGQDQADQPMDIVFRFGMSGYFRLTTEDELPKHSHLRFYSNEEPCRVLSFVDTRRFGSWQPGGTWQLSRGPCVITEYKSFRSVTMSASLTQPSASLTRSLSRRENVLLHLSDRAFDRPICEVLLNQKYFNGIGNYLRAEILFRWQTRVKATLLMLQLMINHNSLNNLLQM